MARRLVIGIGGTLRHLRGRSSIASSEANGGVVSPTPRVGRRGAWSRAVSALGLAVLIATLLIGPASAGPPIDLPRLPIGYDYGPPLDARGYWVGDVNGGEWQVTGGGLGPDDRLTLDMEVRPPPISIPLDAGPAMLFARLTLFGDAGGDVGAGTTVRRMIATALPPCPDPADCVFRGSVTLPTHRLPRLALENRQAESWSAALVSLTLVRTYAQGTWMQVLPLYEENRHGDDGTLGRPRSASSRMTALGAFPVGPLDGWPRPQRPAIERIERLRRSFYET
jgi:hypothetical protein